MKSIEFIGPSGVGKSTFLKYYAEHSKKKDLWITHKKAIKKAIKKARPELDSKILKVLRKINIIGESFGYKNKKHIFEKYNKEIEHITEKHLSDLVESDIESWQKISRIDYFYNTIIYNVLLLENSYVGSKVVIFDESVMHNISTENILDIKGGKSFTKSILFPQGLVGFELSLNKYIKRVEKRFEEKGERRLTSLFQIMSENEIRDLVSYAHDNNEKKIKVCKEKGIPIVRIPAEKSTKNIKKLDEFVEYIYDS